MALVNGVRIIVQAPFTFVQRDTSPSRWLADQAKVLAGMIVVGAALTIPLYALLRATSWWWLWAWGLFAVVTLLTQAAMPSVIRIQTGPLSPAPSWLASRVAAVATQAGVDIGRGVLVAGGAPVAHGPAAAHRPAAAGGAPVAGAAAGRRSRINAYVVGCGRTRRVVLESGIAVWPPELIDQVVAHELGHWRLRHGAARLPMALAAQLATLALAAAVLSSHALLDWAGVTRIGDPRSYPLLLALTAVLVLPARILLATYDRAQERAADRFALALLGAPSQFEAMLERAACDGDAPRLLPWWRHCTASHPPIGARMLAGRRFATECGPPAVRTRKVSP